jgi:hypothetical protein
MRRARLTSEHLVLPGSRASVVLPRARASSAAPQTLGGLSPWGSVQTEPTAPPGKLLPRPRPPALPIRRPSLDLRATRPAAEACFVIRGLVDRPFEATQLDLEDMPRLMALAELMNPAQPPRPWQVWEGVRVLELLRAARVRPEARIAHVRTDEYGRRPVIALAELAHGLLADTYDGEPIPAEQGGPLRLLIPGRYAWQSIKWVTGLELLAGEAPAAGLEPAARPGEAGDHRGPHRNGHRPQPSASGPLGPRGLRPGDPHHRMPAAWSSSKPASSSHLGPAGPA